MAGFSVSAEQCILLLLSPFWRWENRGNGRLMCFRPQAKTNRRMFQNPFSWPLCCPASDFELMIHTSSWMKLNSFNSAHWKVSDKAGAKLFSGWGLKALTTQATSLGMHSNHVACPFPPLASQTWIVAIGCMRLEREEAIFGYLGIVEIQLDSVDTCGTGDL